MTRYRMVLALLFFGLFLSQAQAGPEFVKPVEKEKCPVCGMFVAKYPDWVAEAVFQDGGHAVFDGPKDLFKFVTHVGEYRHGGKLSDITALFVHDYYTVRPIDGRTAFYVLGGDVTGPMGRELIPFEREADAREFLKDHGGKRILRSQEITPAVLQELD